MCRLLPVLIFTIVASAAFAGQKFDFEQFRDRLPWIWQSPQPVDPPKVQDAAWPTDPIDNPLLPPPLRSKGGFKALPPKANS
jgi:hypothetical protein